MATEPIDVESIESVLRAVFPDLAGTTGEIFEQVAYEEGTEAAAPSVRRVAMAEGGWPMPSLEMLGQLVGLPGLAAALPGDVGGFTGLNLASVELDDTSGLITVDVVWADGRLPIVPRLFELSEPGVRFVLDAIPPSEEPAVTLLGTATLGSTPFVVAVELPGLTTSATLAEAIELGPLLEHLGIDGAAFASTRVSKLALSADPLARTMSMWIRLDDVWEPGTGFSLDEVEIGMMSILGDQPTTSGHVAARGTVGGVDVHLSADHAGVGLGWDLAAEAADTTPIVLGGLLGRFAAPGSIPGALGGIEIKDVGFSYGTRSKNAAIHGTLDLPVSAGIDPLELVATIAVNHQPDGTTETKFSGRLTLAGIELDVVFDRRAAGSVVVARFHDGGGHKLSLASLVGAVSHDAAEVLGGADPEVTIHDIVLAYEPARGDVGAKYLFAVDLDLGIDLSGLGDLPLVGSVLPLDQALRVTFQPVITSTDPLTADDLTTIKGLLPPDAPGVPDRLVQGFSLVTTIRVGDLTEIIRLGGAEHGDGGGGLPTTAAGVADGFGSVQSTASPSSAGVATPKSGTSITWKDIQKHFGPLHIDRVGLGLDNGKVLARLDAALVAGPITMSLLGLGADYDLGTKRLSFSLDGISLAFDQAAVSFDGMFLRQDDAFVGKATLRLKTLTIGAVGAYQDVGGHPSMFVYAFLDYPLGGPAFMFVEGLAVGFGYNRRLIVPEVADLTSFPLIAEAMGKTVPAAPAAGKDGAAALRTELQSLSKYVVPELDQYFLAVGIKFNSFKLLHGFALLVVSFGRHLEFDLIGQVTARLPYSGDPPDPNATTLALVTLPFAAKYVPDDGFLGVTATIAPGSFVYTPACHLTGGFAFSSWFSGEHSGDFVFTMGGYHRDFAVPAHYPQPATVPRLGVMWNVDSHLTVQGGLYFALTSSAVMAGGELKVDWSSGDLKAWFDLGLDVLIQWMPYHYRAGAHVEIGASLTVDLGILGTLRVTIEAGAAIDIWGPEFTGHADVHASVMGVSVGFGVDFGHTGSDAPPALSWSRFRASFLPAIDATCTIAVAAGLVRTLTADSRDWSIVNAKEVVIVTDSVVPGGSFGVAPMQRPHVTATASVTVTNLKTGHDETRQFALEPLSKRYPGALWGPDSDPAKLLNADPIFATSGYRLTAAVPPRPGETSMIQRSALQFNPIERRLPSERTNDIAYAFDPATTTGAKRRAELRKRLAESHAVRARVLGALGFEAGVEVDLGDDLAETFVVPVRLTLGAAAAVVAAGAGA